MRLRVVIVINVKVWRSFVFICARALVRFSVCTRAWMCVLVLVSLGVLERIRASGITVSPLPECAENTTLIKSIHQRLD